MSTVPTFACAGATAVIFSSFTTVKLAAGTSPNITALVPFRLVPVMVTFSPPRTEPSETLLPLIAGAGWTSAESSISCPALVWDGASVAPSNGGAENTP
jgi:hypothetical protein